MGIPLAGMPRLPRLPRLRGKYEDCLGSASRGDGRGVPGGPFSRIARFCNRHVHGSSAGKRPGEPNTIGPRRQTDNVKPVRSRDPYVVIGSRRFWSLAGWASSFWAMDRDGYSLNHGTPARTHDHFPAAIPCLEQKFDHFLARAPSRENRFPTESFLLDRCLPLKTQSTGLPPERLELRAFTELGVNALTRYPQARGDLPEGEPFSNEACQRGFAPGIDSRRTAPPPFHRSSNGDSTRGPEYRRPRVLSV
ncbi:MAG: hypothetical protein KatS3mg077_0932 [Candidatus Binatia bacterium]|nr:MAG: hypothetical protein KatS3mg077_0932 [Candidatus Binatia bacterium]